MSLPRNLLPTNAATDRAIRYISYVTKFSINENDKSNK